MIRFTRAKLLRVVAMFVVPLSVLVNSHAEEGGGSCRAWGAGATPFNGGDFALRRTGPRSEGIDDSRAISIESDRIVIRPTYRGGKVLTGAASTERLLWVRSGTAKATVRICSEHPFRFAVWMQSPDNNPRRLGKPGEGVEIDMIEAITGPKRYQMMALHRGGYQESHIDENTRIPSVDLCVDREYRANFGPEGIEYFRDGQRVWTRSYAHGGGRQGLIFSVDYEHKLGVINLEGLRENEVLGEMTVTRAEICSSSWERPAALPQD